MQLQRLVVFCLPLGRRKEVAMPDTKLLQALQPTKGEDNAIAVAKLLLQMLVNARLMRPIDANRADIVVLVANRLRPHFTCL